MGSFTGAVASQKVTEAYKGNLIFISKNTCNGLKLLDYKIDILYRDESLS